MKNLKLKLILLFFGILLFIVVYSIGLRYKTDLINLELQKSLDKLQTNYNIVLHNYKNLADSIYDILIQDKNIIEIIKKSSTKSRIDLYNTLKISYKSWQNLGLKIMIFSNPDNTIFLRVHKFDKYADNISDIRYSITKVNQEKEILRGFESGKISHAFRNIYPLIDEKNNYLGCVDLGFRRLFRLPLHR